jgi:phosphoglycerate dehydrogenase-like enzyme
MKILIASAVSNDAIDTLRIHHEVVYTPGADEDRLCSAIDGCDVLVFRSGVEITARVLDCAPDLTAVIRAGSGYDNIDLSVLERRVLHFFRVPGPGAKAVAEMAFTLMLALSRRLLWADHEWRNGNWVKRQAAGVLMTGKVLGIVGAGNIGSRTGELGAAWGMEVLGCVEHPNPVVEASLAHKGIKLVDKDEVLRRSDFVSVHVPLQASTIDLISAREFELMKPQAFLVNMARGGVVNESDLLEALESGRLAGAGLDVHVHEGDGNISPLAHLDNVLLTPHIGAGTTDTQEEIGAVIVRCIEHAEQNPPTEKAIEANFIVM